MRIIVLAATLLTSLATYAQKVQLATIYADEQVSDYLVSEKLDGIRAIWDGHGLITRQGNPINSPKWFTEGWPDVWLDGELWAGRGQFNVVQSTVLDLKPDNQQWHQIQYMVFDAPDQTQVFQHRFKRYQELIDQASSSTIKAVMQRSVATSDDLYSLLDSVVSSGGEGLMLHRRDALFKDGRSNALLKLKPYQDAEAKVIRHLVGKGKYLGMLGALQVELANGRQFKLGTGFSDSERIHPPKIGEYVTFRYQGLTSTGLPRFASFVRVRKGPFEFREPDS